MSDASVREKKCKLTDVEISLYRAAVRAQGPPAVGGKKRTPNRALKLLWVLNKKYGFVFRLMTEVTDDGFIQYRVKR